MTKYLAAAVLIMGVVLTFYPWISNGIYERTAESAAAAYSAAADAVPDEETERTWKAAEAYNDRLLASEVTLSDPFTYESAGAGDVNYDTVLNMDGSGIMCFVEIPKISVYLPVYHGTSREILQKGAGHVEGTALPIGTEGGRPIISAHAGMSSAKMFTDLSCMEEGDLFFIHVLDETLAYRVVEILVIEPDDIPAAAAREGRDLVSLMTCTPYGVNSHRLVVTGERTEYTDGLRREADAQSADAGSEWMRAYRNAVITALAVIAGILTASRFIKKLKRKLRK